MARAQVVRADVGPGREPRYWPIASYGVVGDCRTAALIAPNGSVDWACLPHFDSPAVLCKLLDADKGGFFRVGPAEAASAEMRYLPETNVLETTFVQPSARLRLLDCVPVRRRETGRQRAEGVMAQLHELPHDLRAGYEREIGNDVAAAHRLTRLLSCLEGETEAEVVLKPTFDYARTPARFEPVDVGEHGTAAIATDGERHIAIFVRHLPSMVSPAGDPPRFEQSDDALRLRVRLRGGERIAVACNYARDAAEARDLIAMLVGHDFDADVDETITFWREWISNAQYDGPYQDAVLRSALALKLCIFEPTGAIVAAPTTSLPEDIGGVRNWDYRYTWLRDSAFTLDALGQLGMHSEARDYFHFIHDLNVQNADQFSILYTIRGQSREALKEEQLGHLEGYRGSHPVRIGNGAAFQRQMDIYGELLDAAYSYYSAAGYRRRHRMLEPERDLRHLSRIVADYVAEHWADDDNGIWEVRGQPRAFVYSRAMCWAALDRACQMAGRHGHASHVQRWADAREAIAHEVAQHGYSERLHAYTQSYGDDVLDAANLRLPLVRYLSAKDPRMADTIAATLKHLSGKDGLIFRYKPADSGNNETAGASDDGLPGTEGAFIACTFWLISNLCHLGRIDEARERFEQLLGYASPLGLFSEEIDPGSGDLLGNFPQAFTHIGLVNTAVTLQRAQEGQLPTDHDEPTHG